MESKTNCPLCKDLSSNCVVEQTIVGDAPFESYICFQCGMTTNSYMALDSEHLEKSTENNTQLMNDLKIIDEERNLVWYPSVINMGEKGLIFPEGQPDNYVWKYAQVVEVPEEEREKYNNYDRRLDVENAESYGQNGFLEACKAMGITKDIK